MPSSKSRSTHLERRLFRLFRESSRRLWTAGQEGVILCLAPHWSALLDIHAVELSQHYKPQYNAAFHTDVDDWHEACRLWKVWCGKVGKVKAGQNCWDAAECLFNVGSALADVGRQNEAAKWFSLAEEMRAYAYKV
ncbi:hypothetical protein LTR62_005161 [Meristemomyces frigidus]|uniref:Uncharacterized protein n=1 Tax=Meristemomyces frigidus TaxID=1508187 RepID=A0AAN7YFJ5_9PEZI|nr:hypothetical protein LTR62_005161 [Meristemomyces frigidus]